MRTWRMEWFLVLAVMASGCGESDVCGDGVASGGEACDDGNTFSGDGCSPVCAIEVGYRCDDGTSCDPVCGDGFVVSAEVCDPSSPEFTEYCASDCSMRIAECGDGAIQRAHESCDDGNQSSRDGCTASCGPAFGWTCDAATGACDASTASPDAVIGTLDADGIQRVCTWVIGMLGGAGRAHECGALRWTVGSVADCTRNLPASIPSCTVADLEGWTAERSGACDFFESQTPICAM